MNAAEDRSRASGRTTPIFEEEQPLPLGWVLLTPTLSLVLLLAAVLSGEELEAGEVALWVGLLLAFTMWLRRITLVTRVGSDEVTLQFKGLFKTRTVPISTIRQAQTRRYRPLLEYGGWGIKLGPSGWAYNVKGNEGVQLKLKENKSLLIGSQRASELAEAITASSRYRPAGRQELR